MASVIKKLADEEALSGRQTMEEGSRTAFILFALDIERLQYVLSIFFLQGCSLTRIPEFLLGEKFKSCHRARLLLKRL